jgi:tripartite-type tricarboxylate transporter receptor subunit TctC
MVSSSRTAPAVGLVLLGLACWNSGPASADDFFKGKVVSLFAGRPPGGGVDSEMRIVAQFLGGHIPGRPKILPQNMPGAGGIALGNHLYNVAAHDGLTLGVPGRTAFLLAPVTGNANARYDLLKFTWIGSAASSNFILWVRRGANIGSLDELRKTGKTLVIGGSGSGNADTVVPELLVKYEKLPFKVIRGYPGTAEQILALERGEIDGMFTERASFRSDPVSSGLAVPIFQTFPIEPNLPLSEDIVGDSKGKAVLHLFSVPLRVGLAVVAPPGLSKENTQILRDAYLATITSKEYRDEAAKRGFDVVNPNPGAELSDYLDKSLSSVPPEVIAEFRTYTE